MQKTVNRAALRLIVVALIALVSAMPGGCAEDFRNRIGIVPMANQTDQVALDLVCRTATDTISLVLRLIGTYAVKEEDEIPELASVDQHDTAAVSAMAESRKLDEVLFGEAARDGQGRLVLSLSIYSRSKGTVVEREESVAETLLDIFDASDLIVAGIASKLGVA
jgi:hypothetical protein